LQCTTLHTSETRNPPYIIFPSHSHTPSSSLPLNRPRSLLPYIL
jgi:hypothetical protein